MSLGVEPGTSNPEVPLLAKSASVRCGVTGPDVYAPGHVGELTQIIDPVLVDAVIEETSAREQRLRLLPARVMVYFVLAMAFFERSSYQAVWGKLTAGLGHTVVAQPCASSLPRARRPTNGCLSRGCQRGFWKVS